MPAPALAAAASTPGWGCVCPDVPHWCLQLLEGSAKEGGISVAPLVLATWLQHSPCLGN